MKNRLAAALALALLPGVAWGQSASVGNQLPNLFNGTLGASAQQMTPGGPFYYRRIWNVSPTGGPTIWCTRNGVAPAPNTGGSFPLAPGQFEEFRGPSGFSFVPSNPTFCIGQSAAVTVEAY
ncbi:MAG: hypothetical protein ACRYHQ_14560 [Janthinobacterium lividum]